MNNLWKSFPHAFSGLFEALFGERNFRLQWLMGLMVVLLLSVLKLAEWQYAVLLLCVFLVLALELLNCALEQVCDTSGKAFDIHKKRAKDFAAAGVLFFSIGAALIFFMVVGPEFPTLIEQALLNPLAYCSLALVGISSLPAVLLDRPGGGIKFLLVMGGMFDVLFMITGDGRLLMLFLAAAFNAALVWAMLCQNKFHP